MSDYNGWTNKETWLVNLWLYDTLVIDKDAFTITADYVRELVYELVDEQMSEYGLVRDLFECSISQVNWQEIADTFNKSNVWED